MRFLTTANKLRSIIQGILVEGRVEDLQKRYPKLDVKEIAEWDPSDSHKHLSWMCKQLDAGAKEEDVYRSVVKFYDHQERFKKRDINQYASAEELKDAVKATLSAPSKGQAKTSGSQKVYEDQDVVVMRVDSKQACISYGGHTKWCITMADKGHFENYKGMNVVFYFVLSKTLPQDDPDYKIAISVQRDLNNVVKKLVLNDAENTELEEEDLYDRVNEPDKILNIVKADAVKQPMGLTARVLNGKASDEDYRTMLSDPELPSEVKARIAKDNIMPAWVIKELTSDKDKRVRQALASNISLPPDALSNLASDDDYLVRARLAHNRETPSRTVEVLANDKDWMVRQEACMNKKISTETLTRLAHDSDDNVRQAVACNVRTPKDALQTMVKNNKERKHIRDYARATLEGRVMA